MNLRRLCSLMLPAALSMGVFSCSEGGLNPPSHVVDKYKVDTLALSIPEKPVESDGNIYVSFKMRKVFTLSAEQAAKSPDWDIAFTHIHGFVNNGSRGVGQVEVTNTGLTDFDKLVNYQPYTSMSTQWVANESMVVDDFGTMPPGELKGDFCKEFVNYYKFVGGHPPKAEIDRNIRVIKTNTGEYVKFQFIHVYKNPEIPQGFGHVTFRFTYLKDQGENPLRDGEVHLKSIAGGTLAQTLAEKETANEMKKEDIKILKISASDLNPEDIATINSLPVLEEIDLSESNFAFSGTMLFSNNNHIVKVILPTSLSEIGERWLQYCANLETVIVPGNNLKKVGGAAFTLSRKLHTVVLPNSVTEIQPEAFSYTGLQRFDLPQKVDIVAGKLFAGCRNLEEVRMSANVTEILGGAFMNCKKLSKLHFKGTKAFVWNDNCIGFQGRKESVYPLYGITWDVPGTNPPQPFFRVYVPKGAKNPIMKAWGWEKYSQYIVEE